MNLIPRWRWWPLAVAFVYFGAANAELPPIIGKLYDTPPSPLVQLGAPLLLSALQALPFALYRADRSPGERALRMAGSLALLTLPGFGFIAWRNPLLVAGLAFPQLGLLGLAGALGLFAGMAGGGIRRPRLWKDRGIAAVSAVSLLAALLAVAALTHDYAHPVQRGMPGWWGMDTFIEPQSKRDPLVITPDVPGDKISALAADALRLGAKVVVFPESVLAPLTPADQIALLDVANRARKAGAVLLVGETIQTSGAGEALAWRNTVRAFGAMDGTIDQSRVPMPLGNWRLRGGAPAHPFTSDIVEIKTRDGAVAAAFSLCYEDTILWPHLGLLTGRAQVMVSMANAWSTLETRGDATQQLSARLLARLAGVPLVQARNVWKPAP
jgi:apolipoprotein N-acyltransferase